MLENIIWLLAVGLAIALVNCNKAYNEQKERANELHKELERLKNQKSRLNYADCLLDDPKTIRELRKNSTELIYMLIHFRTINDNLDIVVRQALKDKISANTEKIRKLSVG